MTERIYYTDPYATEFRARVLEVRPRDGRHEVVLDRTAFYPTSGGQPFDTGTLGHARVIDVVDRDDEAVAHVVEGPIAPGEVEGKIDWERRFDHMQQHTGQHVLSAAFDHVLGARTESFHLGSTSSTIDLARAMTAGDVQRAEAEANRVVWEDRPVSIRFADAVEAAAMPLRKEPARGGKLRLIEVEGFDLSACGGTHVARTGAIGIIAVASHERFKGGTRVEFVCGSRALRAFHALRDTMAESVKALSIQPAELPAAIGRLQAETRDVRRQVKSLQSALAGYEAEGMARGAEPIGRVTLVAAVLEGRDQDGLKALATHIATRSGHAAVLATSTTPVALVIARAPDVAHDSAEILRAVIARFGGRGGGRPELAQGGGFNAAPAEVVACARALMSATSG